MASESPRPSAPAAPTEADEREDFLARLSKRIGRPSALRLAEHFGGRNLYVPTVKRLRPTHEIAQVIGMEAARELSYHWGGNYLSVPTTARTRATVLRLARRGKSVAAIAEAVHRTPRQVKALLADLRGAGYLVRSASSRQPTRPAKRQAPPAQQLDLLFDTSPVAPAEQRKGRR